MGSGQRLGPNDSERAAAVKENEDHGWAGQGDQGQSGEVGNQVEVETHGCRRNGANHSRAA